MKRTNSALLLFVLILLSSQFSEAQINRGRKWNFSIGANYLYPENNFKKTHNGGFGATLKAEYLFLKHLSLTLSSGVYSLDGKTSLLNPDGRSATGTPLKAGLRYYFGNFYLGGEGGVLYQHGFKPGSGVLYALSIGDEIITNRRNSNSLDISFRHEAWVTDKTRAFIGVRLAYEFRL